MNKLAFVAALSVVMVPASFAFTVGTFSDPALDGTTPLFSVTATTVVGSWTGTGLTLELPVVGQTFTDVQMDMQSVTRTGTNLGAGVINFYTTDPNAPIFSITFDSASIFEPFGAGGSYVTSNDVSFGGSALASVSGLSQEHFFFSFANPVSGQNGNTYTASMTSSAVPEPATMVVLAGGAALMAARRRKKA